MDESPETLVMRSVYLNRRTDAVLRQLAFEAGVTKSSLIRAAIAAKVGEWTKDPPKALADVRALDGDPT